MKATVDHTAETLYKTTKGAAKDFNRRGDHLKDYANSQMQAFLADVEDLVEKVGNVADADVARLRDKVSDALANVRRIAADGAESLGDRARAAAGATSGYVRERPWTAIGVAAALALIVGLGVKAAAARR